MFATLYFGLGKGRMRGKKEKNFGIEKLEKEKTAKILWFKNCNKVFFFLTFVGKSLFKKLPVCCLGQMRTHQSFIIDDCSAILLDNRLFLGLKKTKNWKCSEGSGQWGTFKKRRTHVLFAGRQQFIRLCRSYDGNCCTVSLKPICGNRVQGAVVDSLTGPLFGLSFRQLLVL